jgi:hypothetical protein
LSDQGIRVIITTSIAPAGGTDLTDRDAVLSVSLKARRHPDRCFPAIDLTADTITQMSVA